MDYQKYDAADFAADESFQNYHLNKEKDAFNFWERWIEDNKDKQSEVELAKKILNQLTITVSADETRQAYQKLAKSIQQSHNLSPVEKTIATNNRKWLPRFAAIAAAVAMLLIANFIYQQVSKVEPNWVSHQTDFAEITSVYLPDSSVVYLNGNSTLKFDDNWQANTTREVWMSGEAFFEVRKKPVSGAAKFVVHTSLSDVEVLGTSFNILDRRSAVDVSLVTGAVDLKIQKNAQTDTYKMIPGEMISINQQKEISRKKGINMEVVSSWKNFKLVLDKTPLRDVLQKLEDMYGYEIDIQKKNLLDRKITARIPMDDVNLLLEAIGEIYDLDIQLVNNRLKIQ